MRFEEDVPLTVYAVRVSPAASARAVEEYDRLTAKFGSDVAEDWRERFREEIASLATLPLRCLIARENEIFQAYRPGPPLRQLLYGRSGGAAWRILFTAHEATADDPPQVQIHQLRHAAQELLTEWPVEDEQ